MKPVNRLLRSFFIASVSLLLISSAVASDAPKWDVAPSVKKSIAPDNPSKATGLVTATIIIAEDGTVVEAKISKSTDPSLEEPVLVAVKQWLFAPAEVGGKPVAATIKVPFKFQG